MLYNNAVNHEKTQKYLKCLFLRWANQWRSNKSPYFYIAQLLLKMNFVHLYVIII